MPDTLKVVAGWGGGGGGEGGDRVTNIDIGHYHACNMETRWGVKQPTL